jgi:hypothetical protein
MNGRRNTSGKAGSASITARYSEPAAIHWQIHQMKFRKLRIAWSVFWGLACVMFIAVLARSYWKLDGISGNRGSEYVYFDILMGRVHYSRSTPATTIPPMSIPWRAFHGPIFDTDLHPRMSDSQVRGKHILGFGWQVWGNGWEVSVPLWSLVLISGVLATAPWTHQLRWRYTLRTLLIAMTLIAVVLGLAVYVARS